MTSKPKTTARARPAPPKSTGPSRALATAGARRVDLRIRSLRGWRAETLAEVRRLIRAADPEIVEDCKWFKPSNPRGTPVWSHAGIVCTGEAYAKVVKLTFACGASLPDPRGLFNASLAGGTRRAIDLREGERLDARAFKALIRAAVAANLRSRAPSPKSAPKAGARRNPVKLLAGGNPQIAKADGDAPVQAYIAAMPGWKGDVGRRLDALVVSHVPHVKKAVKWNSPFYGLEGRGWFLSFHVFARFVKVAFFRGTSLRPVPPGGTSKEARWIDVHEDDFDEAQMKRWVKQAAALPGWVP